MGLQVSAQEAERIRYRADQQNHKTQSTVKYRASKSYIYSIKIKKYSQLPI